MGIFFKEYLYLQFLQDERSIAATRRSTKVKFLAGANQPSSPTLLLHESISDRDLAVRSGGVRSGIGDHVRRGTVQSL